MADVIRVDYRAWHALKMAACELDITIVKLITLFGEGDAEAIATYQRRYREGGE